MNDYCATCDYPLQWNGKEWEHDTYSPHRGFHNKYGWYNEPPVSADEEAAAIASILKGATHD